jgi:hypothetical protein
MTEYPVLRPGPPYDADGTRVRYGGCTCGAVRFEVRGEPFAVGVCHCMSCRKATGSVSMASANWRKDQFNYTGEIKEFSGRAFCPNCGSRVFHPQGERGAEVMLGALDDGPGDLVPMHEGWVFRREHWAAPVPGAKQFQHDVNGSEPAIG